MLACRAPLLPTLCVSKKACIFFSWGRHFQLTVIVSYFLCFWFFWFLGFIFRTKTYVLFYEFNLLQFWNPGLISKWRSIHVTCVAVLGWTNELTSGWPLVGDRQQWSERWTSCARFSDLLWPVVVARMTAIAAALQKCKQWLEMAWRRAVPKQLQRTTRLKAVALRAMWWCSSRATLEWNWVRSYLEMAQMFRDCCWTWLNASAPEVDQLFCYISYSYLFPHWLVSFIHGMFCIFHSDLIVLQRDCWSCACLYIVFIVFTGATSAGL